MFALPSLPLIESLRYQIMHTERLDVSTVYLISGASVGAFVAVSLARED